MSNIHILSEKKKTRKDIDEEFKKIVVRKNVYNTLKDLGKAGDSFNDVLEKILFHKPGVYKIDVTGKE